jgi:hypothetical protein
MVQGVPLYIGVYLTGTLKGMELGNQEQKILVGMEKKSILK